MAGRKAYVLDIHGMLRRFQATMAIDGLPAIYE